MSQSPDAGLEMLGGLAALIGVFLCAAVAMHLFFAITLMIMAGKTRTGGGVMALFPILNIYLMCKIGRRSGAWVFAMLVPGLNVFTMAMLWASIAGTRGKPSWTGPLVLLPPFTILIPIYLALGRQREPAPVMPQQQFAGRPLHCPRCGTANAPGQGFCVRCQRQLPAVAVPPQPYPQQQAGFFYPGFIPGISFGRAAGAAIVMLVLIVGIQGAAAWHFMGREVAYEAPQQLAPQLPARLAGTMVEFPIDTDPTAPARPVAVITQNFRAADPVKPGEESKAPTESPVPSSWLPPGIDPAALPTQADAMTSATYQPAPANVPNIDELVGPAATATPTDQVYVHVIDMPRTGRPEDDLAANVTRATGGQRTGIQVRSPRGGVYTGSRIETTQITVYVLVAQYTSSVIVVYAPTPTAFATANRLAMNVGNGAGLVDYAEFRGGLFTLPQSPPDDLVLQQFTTRTPAELGFSAAETEANKDPELARQWAQVSEYFPRRFTYAQYVDADRADWNVVVCDFGSARKASNLWLIFRWTLGMKGWQSADIGRGNARYAEEEQERVMLMQRGRYIVLLHGPRSAPASKLIELAKRFQM